MSTTGLELLGKDAYRLLTSALGMQAVTHESDDLVTNATLHYVLAQAC
jgi:hypothetical protein